LGAILAIEARHVSEIAECGSASRDTVAQHRLERLTEAVKAIGIQLVSGSLRANASGKQAFIGVDVAHASDECLIQEGGFDGSAAVGQALSQVRAIKVRGEGFGPQPGESVDHPAGFQFRGDPPHLTETARVDKAQLPLRTPEAGTCVTTRIYGTNQPEELARHAQMNAPYARRAVIPMGQRCQQIFATTLPRLDVGASQRQGKQVRVGWAGHQARAHHLDPQPFLLKRVMLQTTADCLHLGQLGHGV
jgi:hypothetical protein